MSQPKQRIDFPTRKISETFLHFAEPLLIASGPNVTETQLEEPLRIAITVWNAVVYADAVENSTFLDTLRKAMASDPQIAAMIEGLVTRKRTLFKDDHRLIAEYKVFHKDGELRVRAEARDPYTDIE